MAPASREQKIALFLLACLPARLFIANAAFYVGSEVEPWSPLWTSFLLFTAAVGLGFVAQALLERQSGFFGSPVYWSRPAHAALYLLFSLLFALRFRLAPALLLLDMALGAAVFLRHYYY
jgi:hypothetical protein